jgi:hypothetical protein
MEEERQMKPTSFRLLAFLCGVGGSTRSLSLRTDVIHNPKNQQKKFSPFVLLVRVHRLVANHFPNRFLLYYQHVFQSSKKKRSSKLWRSFFWSSSFRFVSFPTPSIQLTLA